MNICSNFLACQALHDLFWPTCFDSWPSPCVSTTVDMSPCYKFTILFHSFVSLYILSYLPLPCLETQFKWHWNLLSPDALLALISCFTIPCVALLTLSIQNHNLLITLDLKFLGNRKHLNCVWFFFGKESAWFEISLQNQYITIL